MKPPDKFPYAGQPEEQVLRGSLLTNASTVLELFRRGFDTWQIARRLSNTTEAQVYALLHRAIEAERRR